MSDAQPILQGIRVLDVASYIAAPVATTIMADFGAEVIKVEPPAGDAYRRIADNPGMPEADVDYFWQCDNRNKRGVVLDLTKESGRAALDRLIGQADVFVTNYTRPAREKLKLTYDDLKPINERLIYASLTAYGESGPEAAKTGFDSTAYWARSGLMHMVKPDPEATPARSLPGQGDHPTGVALFGAIMLALYQRLQTGRGSKVHTSLIANGLWSNAYYAQAVLAGGTAPMRPRREAMPNALTNHYQCRDGHWFILSCVNQEREWERLVQAMERPELAADPRFIDAVARRQNAGTLVALFDTVFASRDWPQWRRVLDEARITFGTVATPDDLHADEQMVASGALSPAADPRFGAAYVVDTPLWVDGAAKATPTGAPSIGEHTEAVLKAAGLSDADLEHLKKDGAIPG